MIYLDANFFIFALVDNTEKGANARRLQEKIIEGNQEAITSVLALDEIMWVLLKNNKRHLLRKAVADIYSMRNITVKEVSPLIPLKALDFMEKFNLKPRDAFHLAVMDSFKITSIVSDDSDFDKIKEIKRIKLG